MGFVERQDDDSPANMLTSHKTTVMGFLVFHQEEVPVS
jgi:hypothetical protein